MRNLLLLFPLAALLSCSGGKTANKTINDSIALAESDSMLSEEPYDWTPEKFKQEHYDEWVVVKHSIDQLQKSSSDNVDYAVIHKLVMEYIQKKNIALPKDAVERIAKIESICKTKFNLEPYVDNNWDMRVSWGTSNLFNEYVLWLYDKEARRVLTSDPFIDIDKEFEMMAALNDAMYDVCDSVMVCMSGSCGYIGACNVRSINEHFQKDMYLAVLGAKIEKRKTLDVPFAVFDKECDLIIANYRYEEDRDEGGLAKDAAPIVKRFQNAFHKWYEHRKATGKKLKDGKFKKDYDAITYGYARTYLLHLKNRFTDIGLMSDSWVVLEDSCSNQELLEYSFEKAHQE